MLSDFLKIQSKNYYSSLKVSACNMSEKQTALTHAKVEKKILFFPGARGDDIRYFCNYATP